MSRSSRTLRWLALASVLICFGAGWLALTDPDEARYAAASREMLARGDPIVPTFNGSVRLEKPPMFYWLQAAAFALLGHGETAARLPSLLAGLATLILTVWWSRLRIGAMTAAPAAMILATTLIFFVIARLAITDMLLTLFITATLILWYEAMTVREPAPATALGPAVGAALACGLATLTKGPVGFVLPGLIIIAASLTLRTRPVTLRGVLLALAGLVAVTGPWVAGLAARIGVSGVVGLLSREVVTRAVSGLDHPRSFAYFLGAFWVLFLPWSLVLPLAIVKLYKESRLNEPAVRFLVVWLTAVLTFFTLIPEKNDGYLLPAAPALALVIAATARRRMVLRVAGATSLLLAALAWFGSEPVSLRRSMKATVTASGLDRPGPGYALLSYRIYKPSLVYYTGRPARWIASEKALREALDGLQRGRAAAIVMTTQRYLSSPASVTGRLSGFETISRDDRYVVLFRPGGESVSDPER